MNKLNARTQVEVRVKDEEHGILVINYLKLKYGGKLCYDDQGKLFAIIGCNVFDNVELIKDDAINSSMMFLKISDYCIDEVREYIIKNTGLFEA